MNTKQEYDPRERRSKSMSGVVFTLAMIDGGAPFSRKTWWSNRKMKILIRQIWVSTYWKKVRLKAGIFAVAMFNIDVL